MTQRRSRALRAAALSSLAALEAGRARSRRGQGRCLWGSFLAAPHLAAGVASSHVTPASAPCSHGRLLGRAPVTWDRGHLLRCDLDLTGHICPDPVPKQSHVLRCRGQSVSVCACVCACVHVCVFGSFLLSKTHSQLHYVDHR